MVGPSLSCGPIKINQTKTRHRAMKMSLSEATQVFNSRPHKHFSQCKLNSLFSFKCLLPRFFFSTKPTSSQHTLKLTVSIKLFNATLNSDIIMTDPRPQVGTCKNMFSDNNCSTAAAQPTRRGSWRAALRLTEKMRGGSAARQAAVVGGGGGGSRTQSSRRETVEQHVAAGRKTGFCIRIWLFLKSF